MAVLIEAGKISQVLPDEALPVLPGDWAVACQGRLVGPGMVDCHSHLVGGQLLPLSGELLLRNPLERFDAQLALDQRLTVAEVEALTAHALARSLRAGVTTVVEHLHAPAIVSEALAVQARVATALGVRLVHSHASHSALGASAAMAQLEANAAHSRSLQRHPLVRSALGFHASFACDDELLRLGGRLREQLGVGAHYHLAESEEDLSLTYARHGRRVVPRFETFGLLGPGGVAAYADAIDSAESARLARTRTLIALSPRFSLASGAGWGGFDSVFAHQNLAGLGTGGTGSLWEELACAFVSVMRVARTGRLLDPDGVLPQLMVGGPAELCAMLYGMPCGNVEPGAMADLVVYDHVPAKDSTDGFNPHLLMQLGQVPVAWTIVAGRVVVRERQLLGADSLQLAADAALALEAVWERSPAPRPVGAPTP